MIPSLTVEKRSLGVTFSADNQANVLVWAPNVNYVALKLTETSEIIPLKREEIGYWQLKTPQLKPNALYTFVLDEEKECQDPASLSQPQGIEGPSAAFDTTAFVWSDQNWVNPPLESYILYELHVGTFTTEGTFAALEKKLDYLKALGVNAVEIMPIAQFSDSRNWGYDGVFTYAVQNSYGGPRDLQQLVNACHAKGIAVVLDVVYNHFGPEGNFLSHFGPYLTNKYRTPWGDAVNFDDTWCDGVRRYILENALMWLRDFHIDTLRLDAAHALKDCSPVHILQELRQQVDQLMIDTGRQHYLIVECDLNDPRFIDPLAEKGYGMDAQWIDEFHHSLRVTVGEQKLGYYADFNGVAHLTKAYQDGYVYDGQFSEVRRKLFGRKAATNPGQQFVVFSQNHDQVGNRKRGERSSQLFSPNSTQVMAGAVLVSPYLPLLFMGEEWSETNPFLYFVSHVSPDLAEAIRRGRKEEFGAAQPAQDVPDPVAKDTFETTKLQWNLLSQEPHQTYLRYYQTLIALRQQLPALHNLNRQHLNVVAYEEQQTIVLHRWHDEQHVLCVLNFSDQPQTIDSPITAVEGAWQKLLDSADTQWQVADKPDVLLAPDVWDGLSTFEVQAASIVIYAQGHESLTITQPNPIVATLYEEAA